LKKIEVAHRSHTFMWSTSKQLTYLENIAKETATKALNYNKPVNQ